MARAKTRALRAGVARRRQRILPGTRLDTALHVVLREQAERLLTQETTARHHDDAEAIHQMRVAARRMRAGIGVIGEASDPARGRELRRELRRVGRVFGEVRDLDVLNESLDAWIRERTVAGVPASEGLDALREVIQEDRAHARARMLVFLESARYRDLRRELRTLLPPRAAGGVAGRRSGRARTVRDALPDLVRSAMATLEERAAATEAGSIEDHHRLRIAVKRLRYLLEFFRDVLGAEAGRLVEELKRRQDELGTLVDAHVACIMIADLIEHWEARGMNPAGHAPEPAGAAEFLAAQYAVRHQRLRAARVPWNRAFPGRWRRRLEPELRALQQRPRAQNPPRTPGGSQAPVRTRRIRRVAGRSGG